MTQYRKKPVVIDAITFDELVEYGRANAGNVTSIVNGMPWSIDYKGHAITHENDECYLIPTLEGTHHMTPADMLITGVKGEIYPCKLDIFEATYEAAATLSPAAIAHKRLAGEVARIAHWLLDDRQFTRSAAANSLAHSVRTHNAGAYDVAELMSLLESAGSLPAARYVLRVTEYDEVPS